MTIETPCLLWDIDGTLIDTTTLITRSLDFIYRKYFGRTLEYDELRALIGTPLKSQIRVFGELDQFGVDEQEITNDFIEFYEARRSEERILQDVIDILIEGKRRGDPTGLVTSKNDDELTNTLPRLGIAEHLDTVVSADDVMIPKPDPEGMRLALERLGIRGPAASQALYIGDTIHDVRAANAAGIRAVAVTWGAGSRADLEAESPAFLCDTAEELRHLLHD